MEIVFDKMKHQIILFDGRLQFLYNCLKSFVKSILFTNGVSNFQMTINILLSKENIHVYKYVCLLFFQDGRSVYSISVRNSIHGKKR